MAANQPLYACTVTVTNSRQSLLALIQATNTKNAGCPGSSRSWNVQFEPSSSGDIYLGDEAVSATNCGLHVQVGGGFLDRASIPGIAPIGSIWVVTGTGTAKLNVMVFGE